MTSRRTRRTPPAVALAVALPLVLSGCGASFQAMTYQEKPVGDGTDAAVGAIAIRNIALQPPESGEFYQQGDDVVATLTLVNDGPEADRLVGVGSSVGEVEVLVLGEPVDAGVVLPRLETTGDLLSLQVSDLDSELRPGQYVDMTLRFERNGEITVNVPVATTGEYDDSRERSENFHEIGPEH